MSQLILYTTHCPKCKVIEAKLDAKKIDYMMVNDVDEISKHGVESVPTLEVDGKRLSFLEANKYVNSL